MHRRSIFALCLVTALTAAFLEPGGPSARTQEKKKPATHRFHHIDVKPDPGKGNKLPRPAAEKAVCTTRDAKRDMVVQTPFSTVKSFVSIDPAPPEVLTEGRVLNGTIKRPFDFSMSQIISYRQTKSGIELPNKKPGQAGRHSQTVAGKQKGVLGKDN